MDDVKLGKTLVDVYKLNVNERTRREEVVRLHQGIVVGATDKFLRVFNPEKQEKGGDGCMAGSQWYAKQSKRIWIKAAGELPKAITIEYGI